jgi:hypothetical protein
VYYFIYQWFIGQHPGMTPLEAWSHVVLFFPGIGTHLLDMHETTLVQILGDEVGQRLALYLKRRRLGSVSQKHGNTFLIS